MTNILKTSLKKIKYVYFIALLFAAVSPIYASSATQGYKEGLSAALSAYKSNTYTAKEYGDFVQDILMHGKARLPKSNQDVVYGIRHTGPVKNETVDEFDSMMKALYSAAACIGGSGQDKNTIPSRSFFNNAEQNFKERLQEENNNHALIILGLYGYALSDIYAEAHHDGMRTSDTWVADQKFDNVRTKINHWRSKLDSRNLAIHALGLYKADSVSTQPLVQQQSLQTHTLPVQPQITHVKPVQQQTTTQTQPKPAQNQAQHTKTTSTPSVVKKETPPQSQPHQKSTNQSLTKTKSVSNQQLKETLPLNASSNKQTTPQPSVTTQVQPPKQLQTPKQEPTTLRPSDALRGKIGNTPLPSTVLPESVNRQQPVKPMVQQSVQSLSQPTVTPQTAQNPTQTPIVVHPAQTSTSHGTPMSKAQMENDPEYKILNFEWLKIAKDSSTARDKKKYIQRNRDHIQKFQDYKASHNLSIESINKIDNIIIQDLKENIDIYSQ